MRWVMEEAIVPDRPDLLELFKLAQVKSEHVLSRNSR